MWYFLSHSPQEIKSLVLTKHLVHAILLASLVQSVVAVNQFNEKGLPEKNLCVIASKKIFLFKIIIFVKEI